MSHLTPVPSDPDGLAAWLTQRCADDVDLGFEWRNPEVDLPPAPEEPLALTVHVSLRDVGWFTLLALAGGVPHHELYDEVRTLCVEAGWSAEDGGPIDPYVINSLMWPTLAAVIGARWNSLEPWPPWVPAAAASVIFGDQPG